MESIPSLTADGTLMGLEAQALSFVTTSVGKAIKSLPQTLRLTPKSVLKPSAILDPDSYAVKNVKLSKVTKETKIKYIGDKYIKK